uniref:Uncharacterized protein n=1 Tax=Nelumbo nucifera TaxID=4432 RepID=A0A822Y8X5_NELNU|nr:TPA_asm: hypothetical protein HUJ06_009365 [Nelumbo nucifera]
MKCTNRRNHTPSYSHKRKDGTVLIVPNEEPKKVIFLIMFMCKGPGFSYVKLTDYNILWTLLFFISIFLVNETLG